MSDEHRIRLLQAGDLPALATLFDSYRRFYGQASDISLSRQFLSERMERKESIIFVAERDAALMGFAQLYPTFSSVSASKAWILNDLYVDEKWRGNGIARSIIEEALKFCAEDGAAWVSLQTGKENVGAQALYEQTGFEKDGDFYSYVYSFR